MKNIKENINEVAVIIPTYKEEKNIRILLKKIFKNIPTAIIVIVDDSPKQEHLVIKKIVEKFDRSINLVVRKQKLGRGSAVFHGLKIALKNKNIKYFFEMDADLAHSPDELHVFLERKKEADLIIGSRYLAKSNIVKWPLKRIVMSRIINIFLHFWLGLNLSDYTNGYRLYNRRAVKFIVNEKLHESGFITLSEIAYKLKKNDFNVIEVPITFTDRKYGKSNAGVKELISSLMGALRIRLQN